MSVHQISARQRVTADHAPCSTCVQEVIGRLETQLDRSDRLVAGSETTSALYAVAYGDLEAQTTIAVDRLRGGCAHA